MGEERPESGRDGRRVPRQGGPAAEHLLSARGVELVGDLHRLRVARVRPDRVALDETLRGAWHPIARAQRW
eukprot:2471086-Prymnesium_polylepis.2